MVGLFSPSQSNDHRVHLGLIWMRHELPHNDATRPRAGSGNVQDTGSGVKVGKVSGRPWARSGVGTEVHFFTAQRAEANPPVFGYDKKAEGRLEIEASELFLSTLFFASFSSGFSVSPGDCITGPGGH